MGIYSDYYLEVHKRRIIENAVRDTFLYNVKILSMGKYVQIIRRKKGYFANYKMIRVVNRKKLNKSVKIDKLLNERFESSIIRTRTRLRRLCMTNYTGNDSFLTLTFAENITSVSEANEKFDLFRRKLKRYLKKLGYDLKYISVIEFQKRGAVHYHIILFDVPKIPYEDIYRLWSNGWVYIKKIKNERMMLNYISKYITKNIKGSEKMKKNEKFYDRSRNLKNVEEIKLNDGIDVDLEDILNDDIDIIYAYEDEDSFIILSTNLDISKVINETERYNKNERRSKYKLQLDDLDW